MSKLLQLFLFLCFLFFLLFNYTNIVYADCSIAGYNNQTDCIQAGGIWKEEGKANNTLTLPNPLTGNTKSENINVLIGKVINAVLGIVGSLALVMFIYGGLTWMTAAGNKEKIQKGKDILIWATIGLIIIFSAYAIVKFVLVDVLQGKTN